MTNIFEQPWLLLIVSGVVLFGIVVFRWIFPEKHRWWLWLLPACIAAAAFAVDFLVLTDAEKVRDVLADAVKAAELENVKALEPLISSGYQDSFHKSREVLLDRCGAMFSQPLIEKNACKIISLDVKPPDAKAVFTVRVAFDPRGPVYEFRKMMIFKIEAEFRKEGDKWFLSRVELLEVDLQPVDWRRIQGGFGELFG